MQKKEGIAHNPIELKKTLVKKVHPMNETQTAFIMIVNFYKLVNSHSRKLTEGI